MIEHVAGRDQGCAAALGDSVEGRNSRPIIAAIGVRGCEIERRGRERRLQAEQPLFLLCHRNKNLSLRMGRDIGERKLALAFCGAPLAERDQTRQAAVSGAVFRKAEEARCIVEVEPRADNQPDGCVLGGDVGADNAGERVAVGHGNRLEAERFGLRDKFVGVGGATQKRKVGCNLQLGIAHGVVSHPKRPCISQRGAPSSAAF